MDEFPLLGFLAIVTLCIGIGIALVSRKKTRDRQKDPTAEKSSLAKDGDSHERH